MSVQHRELLHGIQFSGKSISVNKFDRPTQLGGSKRGSNLVHTIT